MPSFGPGTNKECSTIGHQSCAKLISSTFIAPTQSAAPRNICAHLTRSMVINDPGKGKGCSGIPMQLECWLSKRIEKAGL